MKNNKVAAFILSLTLAHPLWGLGYETWEKIEGPWVEPQAVVAFPTIKPGEPYFYPTGFLSAKDAKDASNTRLWRSYDGETWEAVPAMDGLIVQSFEVSSADGTVFAFVIDDVSNPHRYVYRTYYGLEWTRIGDLGNGKWMDSEIAHGYLYASGTDNKLWRVDYAAAYTAPGLVAWNNVTLPAGAEGNYLPLASFKGYLYSAYYVFPNLTFIRTPDGSAWETYDPLVTNTGQNFGFTKSSERLFFASDKLYSHDGSAPGAGTDWVWEQTPYLILNTIMSGGMLHIMNRNFSSALAPGFFAADPSPAPLVFDRVSDGDIFSQNYKEGIVRKYSGTAEMGNITLMIPDDLWILKRGITDFVPQPNETTEVFARQSDAILAAWSIQFNLQENMRYLKLANLGDAEAGKDIDKLKLYKGGDLKTLVVEFQRTADPLVWETPPGLNLSLDKDDIFSLAADIAATARDKTSIRFSIQDSQWGVNSSFSSAVPSPFVMAAAQNVVGIPLGAGLPPIDGVMIYPSPAKDTVNFLYDLASPSDVRIKLFDRNGLLVAEINDPGKPAGQRALTQWNSSNIASGTYYSITEITPASGKKTIVKKMVFIKR